jgi:hypothetical protein
MVCTTDGFKAEVAKINDECDIDSLCIRWLRAMTHDHGKDGERAEKLIEVVTEMLDIYA